MERKQVSLWEKSQRLNIFEDLKASKLNKSLIIGWDKLAKSQQIWYSNDFSRFSLNKRFYYD